MPEETERDLKAYAHLPALDGLRGIAIALVFQFHLIIAIAFVGIIPVRNAVDTNIVLAMGAGYAGVDLFFVLSGFLITRILITTRERPSYFKNFYARRFLRIFPLYYGFLVFLLVLPQVAPLHGALRDLQYVPHYQVWFWSYLANVPLSFDGILGSQPYPVGHLWSLAIEEQFYLVWPCVVLLSGRRTLLWTCIGVAIGSFLFRLFLTTGPAVVNDDTAYFFTLSRIEPLAVGGLIACLVTSERGIRWLLPWAVLLSCLAFGTLVVLWLSTGGLLVRDPWVNTLGFSALACIFGTLVASTVTASDKSWLTRLLSNSVMVSIGKYSYAIYVIHPVVLGQIVNRMIEAGKVPEVAGSGVPVLLLLDAMSFTLCWSIAWVIWHVYEQHFLKLKRYFETPTNTATGPSPMHLVVNPTTLSPPR